ncbi:MAG TPA: ABC transporter permease [Vicinamibacteria bacterium]|nr:ABC transporter permease [Vicinamibacteria bacterium]
MSETLRARLARRISRSPMLVGTWEAIGLGLAAIRAYKLRAGLTVLGVVMGIMTVTGMSAIVAGLNASMARQIETLGSSVVFIRPFGPGENVTVEERRKRRPLTRDEVDMLKKLPLVADLSALELVRANLIKAGNQKLNNYQVYGTTEGYDTVHEAYVSRGRFIGAADVSRGALVAVIGTDIEDALFPHVDPIDKEISIDGRRFRVIGVTEKRGKFLWQSFDNVILVPLGTLPNAPGFEGFYVADFKPVSPAYLENAVDQVREALRRRRRLRFGVADTFAVFTQETLTNLYRQITGGIYMVMIAISSIGLLVGGVGVMNIMLVSVTERTREIGVRKALGATRRDILWQFLTEAMTLTGAGGLIGIVIGGLLAFLINTFSPFPAVVQPTWVVIAFGVSMAVGLTFGLWPAAKAARLDPIEALRYE